MAPLADNGKDGLLDLHLGQCVAGARAGTWPGWRPGTPKLPFERFPLAQGLLERDAGNSYLAGKEPVAGPMERLLGA